MSVGIKKHMLSIQDLLEDKVKPILVGIVMYPLTMKSGQIYLTKKYLNFILIRNQKKEKTRKILKK